MPTPSRWARGSTHGGAGSGARTSWGCSAWRPSGATTTVPAARSTRRRSGCSIPRRAISSPSSATCASRRLVRRAVAAFRQGEPFPSEGAAVPELVPRVGDSDHASFWHEGYPAVMVTDTANFRYPYYHTPQDTIDKIDFDRMARVVRGLGKVVEALAETD